MVGMVIVVVSVSRYHVWHVCVLVGGNSLCFVRISPFYGNSIGVAISFWPMFT